MEETRRSITILRGNDFSLIWGFSDAQGNPLNLDDIDYTLSIRSSINGVFPVIVDSIENGVIKAHIEGEKMPVGKYYFDFSWSKSSEGVKTSYRSKTDEIVTITEDINRVSDYSTVNVDSVIVYIGSSQNLKDVYVITTEDSTEPSDSNVFSAKRSKKEFISKTSEDSTSYLLRLLAGAIFGEDGGEITKEGVAKFLSFIFKDGLYSEDFDTGYLGHGVCVKIDDNGDSYIEADRLFIRKLAEFVQLIIQELKHVGGQIILTPASMKCTKVEETDTYYRCYFKNSDGDKTIENQFVVGDQAISQTFNVKEGINQNVSNTYYWRLVTGVGEDYIDLSKSDFDSGSTVPSAGDDIVQFGNRNNETRQSAIILSSYGEDSPYMKMYRSINSYDLSKANKIINISKDEVYFCADVFKFTNGKNVEEEVNNLSDAVNGLASDITLANEAIENIQKQVDGVVEIWFYDESPTLDNEPAVNWTTDEEKDRHLGDMYYDADGNGYRFEKRDGQYTWGIISDTAILKALETAQKAQDTADGKKRVFVEQPTDSDAYDVGDLWVNATYEERGYLNDLLRCNVTKTANSPFSIDHWELASKYTDDTKANQAIEDAASAQAAAEKAQEDADAANSELGMIASDNYITPSEKTSLKQQQADIQAERNEIISNATRYGVSTTAYSTAYTAANNALTKYTASSPQNIQVGTDYANISAYYAARKTILDAIATAAKKLVDDVDNDLQGYKKTVTQEFEAVDGKLTSAITETKKYTDSAVGNIQVGGRNYIRNSAFADTSRWGANGVTIAVDESNKRNSINSLKITQNTASDSGLKTIRIYQNATKLSTASLSFWAKADKTASLRIRLGSNQSDAKTVTLTTSWQRFVFENVTPESDAVVLGALSACTWWLSEPMLVEGTKASDWSPSPEDTATKIEENSSKIEQLPDQISLTVDQKIEDIQIGGRNLLFNTNKGAENWIKNIYNGTTDLSSEIIRNVNSLKVVVSKESTSYHVIHYRISDAITNLSNGHIYTLSFDILSSVDVSPNIQISNSNYSNIIAYFGSAKVYANEWTHVKLTKTLGGEDSYYTNSQTIYIMNLNKVGTYYIQNLKLEEGNKATDWTPAPEDVGSQITELSSEIKQTAESISLKVNQSIGGENLIDNSSFSENIKGWNLNGDSGNIAASIVNTTALGSCLSLFTKQVYAGLFRAISEQYKGIIEPEAVFTVSFDLYKTSRNPSQLEVGFEEGGASESNTINIQNHPLNTWRRVSLTQTLKTSRGTVVIYSLTSSASTVYIKNFKVERGSKDTEWTPSDNDRLLSTGIDILNKNIILTADNTLIQDNSGNQIAMFTTENGKPLLSAGNIDVNNLKVKHLDSADGYFQGKITADGAVVGGFTIQNNVLKSGVEGAGISFSNEEMSNLFLNRVYTQTLTVDNGINSYDPVEKEFTIRTNRTCTMSTPGAGTDFFVADVMNLKYKSLVSSGRYGLQYAMVGSGHIVQDGIVDGGCWYSPNFTTNNQVHIITPFDEGNRICVTTNYTGSVLVLPSLDKLLQMLGWTVVTRVGIQFSFNLIIVNASSTSINIIGKADFTVGDVTFNFDQYPTFYNSSGNLMDSKGDYTIGSHRAKQFILTYDGTNYNAFEL